MLTKTKITAVFLTTILIFGGCCSSSPHTANRSLVIEQPRATQSQTQNQTAQIPVDTSQLPPGVIEQEIVTFDRSGSPATSLKIKPDYPVKILLIPATQP